VDAIQSLGVLPMDVKKDYIDFLSADGHKWMLSVEGLGGFYISKEVIDRIRPVTMGWGNVVNAENFMDYDFTLKKDAKKFEEGTPNTMSIHAFGAALGLLLEAGIYNIENRVMNLGDCVIAELNRRNIKIYSSTISDERSGNVSFTLKKNVDLLYSFMMANKVKLTVRDGLVRLSPHFYNNEDEILKVFDLLDEFLKK